jgi:hypothetical protein
MQKSYQYTLLFTIFVSAAITAGAFRSASFPSQRCSVVKKSHHFHPVYPIHHQVTKQPVAKFSLQPFLNDAQVATATLADSLFRYSGNIPLWQAFGINAVLFSALQSKLLKMLTPAGFLHSMALGTGLWATLGWRGWTLCVLYLFLGQAVTKVRFAEKEKLGIAEKRGGRRGPENVWCVAR